MLYLIGLGLNERGISKEGLLAIEKCKKVYLEGYTIEFPYNLSELKLGKKKIIKLGRTEVESDKLIKEAKSVDIVMLVYGSPFFSTTHISLILDAKKENVKTKIIYSASVFDAIAESGLRLSKFGKITSMPTWEQDYKPDFMQYIKENQKIKAHSLILVDIGIKFEKALLELEENSKKNKIKLNKIVVCSRLGTCESKILYEKINELKKQKILAPFCLIIPSELHFMEKDALERFEK